MATARKGLRVVKTMAGLSDHRHSRSAAGAMLELSILARHEERLGRELAALECRRNEIQIRLAEIAEKEARLKNFIKDPPQIQEIAAAKTASFPGSSLGTSEVVMGVKTKEIRY